MVGQFWKFRIFGSQKVKIWLFLTNLKLWLPETDPNIKICKIADPLFFVTLVSSPDTKTCDPSPPSLYIFGLSGNFGVKNGHFSFVELDFAHAVPSRQQSPNDNCCEFWGPLRPKNAIFHDFWQKMVKIATKIPKSVKISKIQETFVCIPNV